MEIKKNKVNTESIAHKYNIAQWLINWAVDDVDVAAIAYNDLVRVGCYATVIVDIFEYHNDANDYDDGNEDILGQVPEAFCTNRHTYI